MKVSQELAIEAAEELGVHLTIPNDEINASGYWWGFRSGETETTSYNSGFFEQARNAGIRERIELDARRREHLGYFRYTLSRLLRPQDLAI